VPADGYITTNYPVTATKVGDLVIMNIHGYLAIYQGYTDEYVQQGGLNPQTYYAIHGGLQYLAHYNVSASQRIVLCKITSSTFYLRNVGGSYPVTDIVELV